MTEWILSSSILILIVIGLRAVLKGRIGLRLQYAIWGLVLLRLLIPFSIGSTAFSVANFTSREDAPAAVIQTVKPQENLQTDHTVQQPQVRPGDQFSTNAMQNAPLTEDTRFDLKPYMLYLIWAVGAAGITGAFLVTNFRFRRKILDSRYELGVRKNDLDVYVCGEIETPCLFGIPNPAIYVTNGVADNQTVLRHTLEHEATHHRHGDHIWAILRCVCLVLHWYNPLVWLAAFLSRRDAELACDEATILRLGEAERAEYGRTLIDMTCRKQTNVLMTATTMTTGKSGIKERIVLIAKKPRTALYALVTVILVAAVAVGCTFTGARENMDVGETLPPVTEPSQTQASEPGTEATTEPLETQPVQTQPVQTQPVQTQPPEQGTDNITEPAETEGTGDAQPLNPMGITKIRSATLDWNGVHTVTDTYALNRIEKWLLNSREIGSAACGFGSQLTLEMEDGQTKILYMATDSCAACMCEGVTYSYAELTEVGLTGNEEFYSLFAQPVIHEKAKKGMDAVNEFLIYLNWSRYYMEYGAEETFALMDMIEAWVAEEPTFQRYGGLIGWSKGLDGAFSEGYGYRMAKLYELAPSEFAWACLGNATDENEAQTIQYLAFEWNMTHEEVRAKLEAQIPRN